MPVIAAAKSRRQFQRRGYIRIAIEDVADLVRIFFVHASEGETREALGGVGVELRRWIFGGQTEQRQKKGEGGR
jgi:hypothetical protein